MMETQQRENYKSLQTRQEKRQSWRHISGRVVKNYRKKQYLKNFTTPSALVKQVSKEKRLPHMHSIKKQIAKFLQSSENSKVKNDFVKKKINKEKSLCCAGDYLKEQCPERKCEDCIFKIININQFEPTNTLTFEKWCTKRVTVGSSVAHFGGSKQQLSLQTVLVYYQNPENNSLQKKRSNMCTSASGSLSSIHCLRDGPSTQYRNRKVFHLIANYLSQQFNLETIRWHYSEKGHGKEVPDGVGGT
nr:unnamed protein product [Callosobruchus analis]